MGRSVRFPRFSFKPFSSTVFLELSAWSRGARKPNISDVETVYQYCLVQLKSAKFVSRKPQKYNYCNYQYQHKRVDCKPADISRKRLWGKTARMEGESAACQHVKSDELCKGKWIGLSEITYKDPRGKDRKWEGVFRTTKIGDGTDAVVIVPIVKRANKPDSVILVKQYRPPMKAYSLEFPAGLIDKGEDPQKCAVRELKEETGYTGVPLHISPGVSLDPGLANSTINMVTVEIDGDSECNRKPEQQQDEGEFIEVISVPVDELLKTLDSYSKEGVVVHSILYTYAMALSHTAKPPKNLL